MTTSLSAQDKPYQIIAETLESFWSHAIGDCNFFQCHPGLRSFNKCHATSIYKSLNCKDLEPTRMTIQLANRSVIQPLGVLEDVLVQVDELIFLVDFYVLDMEGETPRKGTTLILARPFLMSAKTKIDMHAGTLLVEFGDTLHPMEDTSLFRIDLINELVKEHMQADIGSTEFFQAVGNTNILDYLGSVFKEPYHDEPWELYDAKVITALAHLDHDSKSIDSFDQVHKKPERSKHLEVQAGIKAETKSANQHEEQSEAGIVPATQVVDSNQVCQTISRPSGDVSPPKPPIELKPLPGHLKYAYLGDEQQFLVIIASNLHQEQEEKLLQVTKPEICWNQGINDSVGLDLDLATFCINSEILDQAPSALQMFQASIVVQDQDLGSWKLSEVIARYSQCTPVDGNLNAWPSLVQPSSACHQKPRPRASRPSRDSTHAGSPVRKIQVERLVSNQSHLGSSSAPCHYLE
ncbi:hypothetical protein CR513_28149, partial [Mucuna pruriens]